MDQFLSQVQALLATTAARWADLVAHTTADLLARPPAPGQWAAAQCLQHLVDTEPIFGQRIAALRAGRDFPAFDPDTQGTPLAAMPPPSELVSQFARLRAESLAALGRVAAADLGRQARHAELGQVTLRELLAEWVAHDLNHTIQGERALMQPFILASGPWQPYFADHLVAG
jgi:hypothetical protein